MSRFFTQGVALLVLVTFIANSNGQWYDCGTTLSQRLVRFNTFSAYPSPAIPGQQVHLRATYQAYVQLDETAYVELNILYGPESVLHVTGIPLCNLTSSVSCPVVATPNYTQAISFDWLVPSVADGNYLVNFIIKSPDSGKASAYGCIAFNVSVYNPSATSNGVYASYYQAQLEGDAQFTTSPFLNRDVGSYIQVGPIGPLGAGLSWGTFDYISGSGDVVHQSFDASNYLWGLSGMLLNKSTDLTQSSHFYQGQFWIGYSGPYGNYNTQNNTLTGGTFTLTHSQVGPSNYTFNGVLTFLPYGGAFPTGWFNPINLARLGPSVLATNQYGHLIASASTGTCLADPTSATCTGTYNQVTQPPSQDSDPHHLKIILPVVLGFFVLFIVIPLLIFAVIRHRRNRSRISEDRVYNPRPAEYGSALVVDDIMQKSRNHTGAELPILDPSSRQSFPPAYLDDYPAPVIAPPRTVRRTPQEPRRDDRRRSPRQDRRPAPRRPAYSDTDSEPQLRGRGANRSRSPSPRGRDASLSRSRSRSRSRSLSRSRSISRSRSPSRSDRGSRSRSVSRSMSRSRSPVSGSSVSRSSFSEGPRR